MGLSDLRLRGEFTDDSFIIRLHNYRGGTYSPYMYKFFKILIYCMMKHCMAIKIIRSICTDRERSQDKLLILVKK